MLQSLAAVSLLAACLVTVLPAYAAAAEPNATLPSPSASRWGWVGLSVGIGQPEVTATLASSPRGEVEGDAGSDGNYRLLYERRIFGAVGLRGFVSRTDWGTSYSDAAGDGSRTLTDFGAAPVLSYSANQGRHGASLYVFAPISFSLSQAPARATREIVRETMDLGIGYRVGGGLGMLVRLSGKVGLLCELEASLQRVSHVRTYARVDGTGKPETLPIGYGLTWLGAQIGLAILP
jgi:hypothetical protein